MTQVVRRIVSCLQSMRRRLRVDGIGRFSCSQTGIAAVEFALILPFMLVLFIGGSEVGQSIAINRKVAQVSYSLGDLISQSKGVTTGTATGTLASLPDIFTAASAVMLPYNAAGAQIIVGVVSYTGGQFKVVWSQAQNATAWTPGSTPPATVTIPTTLFSNGQQVIVAQVVYTYSSPFTAIMANIWGSSSITLSNVVYLRPRQSTTIACTGC